MRSIAKRSSRSYGIVIAVLCLFLTGIATLWATQVQATTLVPTDGQKLVTVHDRGQDKGILTRAATLREAFEQAHIHLDPNDTVEPGLDEPLVATSYDVNIYRARPVTIVDGAVREKVMSPYRTAKQIAEQANIILHDEDITTLSSSGDMLSRGASVQLTIKRATAFTLVLYGTKTPAYTQQKTVAGVLKEKSITIGKNDTLSVLPEAAMTNGMTIELWRNGKQTAAQEEEIPFETEKIQDMDREVGYKEVKTAGQKGKKTVTYEIEMKNGQEISRKEIQSVVTSEPKKQVEIVGAKLSNTFSGSFAEALARLRACESGGNYANKKNPKYRGAYQYDYSTWANYQGFYDPADAPPAVQDEKAWQTYQRRGWQPWPSCKVSQGLQDIYR